MTGASRFLIGMATWFATHGGRHALGTVRQRVYQVRSSSGQEPLVACSACVSSAASAGGRIAAAVRQLYDRARFDPIRTPVLLVG